MLSKKLLPLEKKEEYILNMKKGYFVNEFLREEVYGQLNLAKQIIQSRWSDCSKLSY